jgi:hypothetical protein
MGIIFKSGQFYKSDYGTMWEGPNYTGAQTATVKVPVRPLLCPYSPQASNSATQLGMPKWFHTGFVTVPVQNPCRRTARHTPLGNPVWVS